MYALKLIAYTELISTLSTAVLQITSYAYSLVKVPGRTKVCDISKAHNIDIICMNQLKGNQHVVRLQPKIIELSNNNVKLSQYSRFCLIEPLCIVTSPLLGLNPKESKHRINWTNCLLKPKRSVPLWSDKDKSMVRIN